MLVSELVARTGVPLATVKYYLREGLLMPGASTSATRAQYDDSHARRLRLIKALAGLGITIPRIRSILALIDDPGGGLFEALGAAVAALPPYSDASDEGADCPRARAVIEQLGWLYDEEYAAVGQLERALAAAESVGLPMTPERAKAYGRHVMGIAEAELAKMPTDSPQSAVEYAVIGTAIYEPVIAAMRRLAHQTRAARLLDPATSATPKSI
jgi:DNA-binding transcriptional MerR regulator